MWDTIKQKNNLSKILVFSILVLIVFLSLFPRSIEVLNGNPIFGFDQGRDMLAARNIAVKHKPILIGAEIGAGSAGISGVFQGPGYYFLLTIPFILFNGSPVGGVFMMLFLGLSVILFGYFFGKQLFGGLTGLLVSFIIAISPVLISQSRFIWSPNAPTIFILLSFYFTYLLISKKRNIFIVLASFFAGFVYNFELAIAVPLSLTLILYSVFLFKKELKNYVYLFLGFVVAYSPMIAFEIRHNFQAVRGVLAYLLSRNKVSGHPNSYYILDHFKSFIFNFKDTFPINNFNFSLIFFAVLIITSVYLLRTDKNKNVKQFFSFLLLLLPVNLLVFYFLKNTVWSYYLTDLSLSYIFLFSYIVYSLFKIRNIKLNFILIVLIGFMALTGFNNAIYTSLHDYSDYGGTAKVKGKIDAIDYIYKDSKGKPFGVLVFSPPVYTYPYDYLFWWYGQRKYGYMPYNDKKGTFYLLIEPDPSKPWSYKGWLQTVIKSGKVENTITFPSGFIIQKRVENG